MKKIRELEPKIKEIKDKEESELEEDIEEATKEIKQEASQELLHAAKFKAPSIILKSDSTQNITPTTQIQQATKERQSAERETTRRETTYARAQQTQAREPYSSSRYTSRDIAPILERREATVNVQRGQNLTKDINPQTRIQREEEKDNQYEAKGQERTRRRRVWEGG